MTLLTTANMPRGDGFRSTAWILRDMFSRRYRWRLISAVVVMLAAGLAEIFGIAAILPVLMLATKSANAAQGFGATLDKLFNLIGGQPPIEVLLVIVIGGICLKSVLTVAGQQLIVRGTTEVAADFRADLIRALMDARWNYMVGQRTGAIANAISNDALRAGVFFASTVNLFATVLTAIPFILIALRVSWQLAVGAFVASGLIILLMRGTFTKTRRHTIELMVTSRSLVTRLVDSVVSLKPLKAMGLQDRIWPYIKDEVDQLSMSERRQNLSKNLQAAVQEPLLALIVCAGLYASLTHLQLNFAEIGFMLVLFQRLVARIALVQSHLQNMMTSEAPYLHMTAEIKTARAVSEFRSTSDYCVANQSVRLKRDMRFTDVCLSYEEGRDVFEHLNLLLPAGRMIVVVGPSGAGKTTLVDMMIGLQLPQSGTVTIDGVRIAPENIASWRKRIGYVPQELQLLNGTILANLTLMDASFGRDDAQKALVKAGIWDFVASLPQGMDTPVGERGAAISGGQRQRIAIARALIQEPDLLILDEATTALDPETEKSICANLRELAGSLTIVAISHQPELAKYADLTVRIDAGKVRILDAVDAAIAPQR